MKEINHDAQNVNESNAIICLMLGGDLANVIRIILQAHVTEGV